MYPAHVCLVFTCSAVVNSFYIIYLTFIIETNSLARLIFVSIFSVSWLPLCKHSSIAFHNLHKGEVTCFDWSIIECVLELISVCVHKQSGSIVGGQSQLIDSCVACCYVYCVACYCLYNHQPCTIFVQCKFNTRLYLCVMKG